MRLILFCLLLVPMTVAAQVSFPARQPIRPPFTFKISPLGLINPVQQSFVVQADIPIYARWALDLGIGPILNSSSYASKQGENYRGMRYRPAIKYYMRSEGGNYSYLSISFKIDEIFTNQYVEVFRQGRQYKEWWRAHTYVSTRGVSLQFGSQERLGKRKRWLLEPFLGIGVRQKKVTTDNWPSDAEAPNDPGVFGFERRSGTYNAADVMAGMRLGWVLGKR
ncbi:MAG: hypothetical protein WCR52_01845 [Bacteroidota bacterium]